METPDVLIIGGGIIGCSLARELARARLQVIVVERSVVGSGASGAAAGLLSPAFSAGTSDPLGNLCAQSADIYASWVEELQADGAGDVGFRRPGVLEVWRNAQEEQEGRRNMEATRSDDSVEFLSVEEVHRREPGLIAGISGGAFHREDAQVDPVRLMHALGRVCRLSGVTIRENEPVLRVVREGERITAVHTISASYWPGLVLLTAGAWSGGLAEVVGLDLPTQPVKGQLLQAQCPVSPVRGPVHAAHCLFVPLPDGDLVLGVTVEDAGFDERVTLKGVSDIVRGTSALVPAVADLPLVRAWAGLRPSTPDGCPYMGLLPPFRNLWVSTGHFRKGILLAPLSARLVAQSILADEVDEALLPFKPARRPG